MRKKDVRTLCYSCKAEYQCAGYKTKLIWTEYKEPCDKCRVRMGWLYILISPKKDS